jgi:hypothetical protein
VNGVPDDDAFWPLHLVRSGTTSAVRVELTGISPLSAERHELMSLPYALFEFSLKNEGPTSATAALALQLDLGETPPVIVPGKGFRSKAWSVYAAGFLATGACDNTPAAGANKTAARVELKAGESATVRFVIAWHDDRDPEWAHYLAQYSDAGSVAEQGLANFDELKANAERFARGMRASNLPDWLVNQTQNTLANYATNSMYKRDGRVSWAEGQWTCFGTMDQMWHSRQIVYQLTPWFAWQELRYWARTQMKNGQIHHDFNAMEAPDKSQRAALVGWDDTEHKDYRNIQKWVDLNCAYIISVFEAYQATGNREEFLFHWPHLKRAARRVLDQVATHGSKQFPYTFDGSENSYDAGGQPDPFNASISAVAYRLMARLGREMGEDDVVAEYQKAHDTVVRSFAARYLQPGSFPTGKHCEAHYGGQWLALQMELGEIWPAEQTDFVLDSLAGYYNPAEKGLGYPEGTYDEWTPYILVHYAGLLLNAGQPELWERLQKDAYERQYLDRNRIFNHPLNILPVVAQPVAVAKEHRSKKQYMSLPGLWRNYYDIVGFHRDARTKELWLKPILPPELKGRMTDAYYVSPEGNGTISCAESGERAQNRRIVFKPERPLEVDILYLADHYAGNVTVNIDDSPATFERIGTGHARLLKVGLKRRIGAEGLRIETSGDPAPAPVRRATPAPKPASGGASATASYASKPERFDAFKDIAAADATKAGGTKIERAEGATPYVTSCNNFDYIQFSKVDFGEAGAAAFLARVANTYPGASIEVALDDVAGEPVASCVIPTARAAQDWATVSVNLRAPVKGVHDVYLRFYGGAEENLLDLQRIRFAPATEAPAAP